MMQSEELLAHRPARYLAASDGVLRALVEECGIDPGRIAVIHEFIPEQRINDVIGLRAEAPRDDTLVVGGAGYPDWRKGITFWLLMAAELRRSLGRTVRFVWVGAPEWPDPRSFEGIKFRRMVQLMGLDDVVEIIPSTPRPLEHFARFDIFAMTSWEDPCPLVVLENMGIGTPVVCFAGGGGAPEVLGDTGVIIPDFNPQSMARAIAELAANPAEMARLGALARRRMLTNYTDRVQVPKIRREVMALGRAGAADLVGPRSSNLEHPAPSRP
jgi:glycosyltransferase involved in cell wall biosynthesis